MKILEITNEIKSKMLEEFTKKLEALTSETSITINCDLPSVKDSDKKHKLIFTPEAYVKMTTLVDKCSGEVGWNGVCKREGDDYKISDILVYPQKVSGSTVTCDEIETGNWLSQLDDETFNNLRFQAHSHVNMGVSPSPTDETLYEKYLKTIEDFYVFMIINKKRDLYIRIYDKVNNIILYKSDIEIEIEGSEEFWNANKNNIKENSTPSLSDYRSIFSDTKNVKNPFDKCDKQNCNTCKKFEECATNYYNMMMEVYS